MANIKSQKKRILTNAKAAERNKAVKSELKTRSKNAVNAIGTASGEESLRLELARRKATTLDARMRIPLPPGPTFPHNLRRRKV